MKPFSLHTVLSYRKRLEDIAKNRLFEAQTEKQKVQDKLTEEENGYTQLLVTLERLQTEGIDILDLIRYEDQILFTKNRIISIKKTLSEKIARVANEREHLIQRSKERKIMEKLKEKQNQSWQEYLNKKEAALLDEIAIIFHDK
ncbi:MAG: flagellar export protein FliJ [Desulfoprunum sp.]|nr:flagellar export protein FliJ [Desulfoprunum sp.]